MINKPSKANVSVNLMVSVMQPVLLHLAGMFRL